MELGDRAPAADTCPSRLQVFSLLIGLALRSSGWSARALASCESQSASEPLLSQIRPPQPGHAWGDARSDRCSALPVAASDQPGVRIRIRIRESACCPAATGPPFWDSPVHGPTLGTQSTSEHLPPRSGEGGCERDISRSALRHLLRSSRTLCTEPSNRISSVPHPLDKFGQMCTQPPPTAGRGNCSTTLVLVALASSQCAGTFARRALQEKACYCDACWRFDLAVSGRAPDQVSLPQWALGVDFRAGAGCRPLLQPTLSREHAFWIGAGGCGSTGGHTDRGLRWKRWGPHHQPRWLMVQQMAPITAHGRGGQGQEGGHEVVERIGTSK